jgi:hypothetical protein
MKDYDDYELQKAEDELRDLVEIAEDVDSNVHKLRSEKTKFFTSLMFFVVAVSMSLYLFTAYSDSMKLSTTLVVFFAGIIPVTFPLLVRYRRILWELSRESSILRSLIELIENRKKVVISKSSRSYINPSIEIRIKRIDFSAGEQW